MGVIWQSSVIQNKSLFFIERDTSLTSQDLPQISGKKIVHLQVCHQTNSISDCLGQKLEVWGRTLISPPSIHPSIINWQKVNSKEGALTYQNTAFTLLCAGGDKLKVRGHGQICLCHPSTCAKRMQTHWWQPNLQNVRAAFLVGPHQAHKK